MRLDIQNHENNHYSLWEHEGDEIEDFEGHDLIERRVDPDSDDMTWLFPPKGPGEFKDLKRKKKQKKKTGKK